MMPTLESKHPHRLPVLPARYWRTSWQPSSPSKPSWTPRVLRGGVAASGVSVADGHVEQFTGACLGTTLGPAASGPRSTGGAGEATTSDQTWEHTSARQTRRTPDDKTHVCAKSVPRRAQTARHTVDALDTNNALNWGDRDLMPPCETR